MKLTEAIEIVSEEVKEHHSLNTDIIGQAQRILIGAGKREMESREGEQDLSHCLLPGETKE